MEVLGLYNNHNNEDINNNFIYIALQKQVTILKTKFKKIGSEQFRRKPF